MTDEVAAKILEAVGALSAKVGELEAQIAAMGEPKLVGPKDACRILGLPRSTFERWRREGNIPAPRKHEGRSPRWLVSDLLGG